VASVPLQRRFFPHFSSVVMAPELDQFGDAFEHREREAARQITT
jgi:hypothetical protein